MARSENNLRAVLQDTADAIRGKTGSQEPICPRDFADEIETISTGVTPEGTYYIDENGEYDITEYASVDVSVPDPTASLYPGLYTFYQDELTYQNVTDNTYAWIDTNKSATELDIGDGYYYLSDSGYAERILEDPGVYCFYGGSLTEVETSAQELIYFDNELVPTNVSLEEDHYYQYGGGSYFSEIYFEDGSAYVYSNDELHNLNISFNDIAYMMGSNYDATELPFVNEMRWDMEVGASISVSLGEKEFTITRIS